MRGLLSLDAIVALSMALILVLVALNFVHTTFNSSKPFGLAVQASGVATAIGILGNAYYALDPGSGRGNFSLYYDSVFTGIKYADEATGGGSATAAASVSYQPVPNTTSAGTVIVSAGETGKYPTFASDVSGAASGTIRIESALGGVVAGSAGPLFNLTVLTCPEVLSTMNTRPFTYQLKSVSSIKPWECLDDCIQFNNCPGSCRPDISADCNYQCINSGKFPAYGEIPAAGWVSGGTSLSCKVKGPYYNESQSYAIPGECGPPPIPGCGNASVSSLNEEMWVSYAFNLTGIVADDIYASAIARNSATIYVNGRIASCSASGTYSKTSVNLKDRLVAGENRVVFLFTRGDSICGPCVKARPAFGVGGAFRIGCDPFIDKGVEGWQGCNSTVNLDCT